MKLRTIPQAIREIKLSDPSSAVTHAMIMQLVKENSVSYVCCGKRICFDMEVLVRELNQLFDIKNESIPRLRTIRNASKEMHKADPASAVTEYRIRMWINESRLRFLAVGSRQIIAMESFDYLRLFGDTEKKCKRNYTAGIMVSDQFEELLSNTTQGYICRRKR